MLKEKSESGGSGKLDCQCQRQKATCFLTYRKYPLKYVIITR